MSVGQNCNFLSHPKGKNISEWVILHLACIRLGLELLATVCTAFGMHWTETSGTRTVISCPAQNDKNK